METKLATAEELMLRFADRTGLTAADKPRRYLWTDAFAVCNFLALGERTRDRRYRDLALRLVDQVHAVLGRHREDDPRHGWLSGLGEAEGERYPTRGGLRIGKPRNERGPDDPPDERLEWERDGQYFHYLTKWMHALNCVSAVTGDPGYRDWAVELARGIHPRFVYLPPTGGRKRIHWKMSIDLSRPLVPSMGQHDPLDGLVTYAEIAGDAGENAADSKLAAEIADLAEICRGMHWETDDPLGTGGLLVDALRLAQLLRRDRYGDRDLLLAVVDAAARGLDAFAARSGFALPAEYRLGFRELGLSIGLGALERLQQLLAEDADAFDHVLHLRLPPLMRYLAFRDRIETFWIAEGKEESGSWLAHREINIVMLATSLLPEGFLIV